MAASREDISGWFDRCKAVGDVYMIVACDTFSHEDYPVGAKDTNECRETLAKLRQTDMTRIMEVYDLSADKETQLNEPRCMRLPL